MVNKPFWHISDFVLATFTFGCVKMSDFVTNNSHLREVLIFFFHSKKTVAEAHRELQNVYGNAALSETRCRDWFRCFKDGDFNVDDRPREGRPKTFEDAELEALLDEDPCQTQDELASELGVTRQVISKRLHALGIIQKQGTWVPYDLRSRDVERRYFACEQLLQRQKMKGFLHRIVTGDEKWIYYSNTKRRKSWELPGLASTSSARPNIHAEKVMLCIWWDQVVVIYYVLLKPKETITEERYQTQLMRLIQSLREKPPQYEQRHEKVILQCATFSPCAGWRRLQVEGIPKQKGRVRSLRCEGHSRNDTPGSIKTTGWFVLLWRGRPTALRSVRRGTYTPSHRSSRGEGI